MEVLNTLLSVTIYSGVIFAATMLVKKLLKNKMSPFVHFAVWMVLVARLLIPVTIDSPVHLFTLPAQEQQAQPAVPALQQYLNAAMPATGTGAAIAPATTVQPAYDTQAAETSDPAVPAAVQTAYEPFLPDILLTVWLAGIGAFLLYLTAAYIALRRETQRRAAQPSKRLTVLFEEVKAEIGIKRNVRLVCQYQYGMPALMFPGTILMPFDALVTMDDEQVKFALRHELTHYKRGDHLISVLLSLLLAVYWFNPFVWLAFRQIHMDMETACDSAVVRALDRPARSRYAALIISLFAQPGGRVAVLGAAQGNARKAAEQRVRGIFMDEKSRKGVKFVSVLLAAVLFAACFTTACQPMQEKAAAAMSNQNTVNEPAASESSAAVFASATAPALPFSAPKTYNNTYNQDNHTLVFDAAVEVPDAADFPVYNVQSAPFTQAEADTFAKVLMQGKPLENNAKPMTKAQIAEQINKLEAERNSIKNDGKSANGRTKEQLDQTIEEVKKDFEKAPESVPEHQIVDSTLSKAENGSQQLDVSADLGKNERATMMLIYAPRHGSILHFSNGNGFAAITGQDTPKGLKITRDQAVAEAQKTVADMGYSQDFAMSAVTAGRSLNDSDVQDYIVIFTRRIGSIPFTYEFTQQTSIDTAGIQANDAEALNDYLNTVLKDVQTYAYERITVCVDDTGITDVEFDGKMDVQDKVQAKAALMPFDDIIKTFEQHVFNHYPLTDPANKNPQSPVKSTFYINRITLGYTRQVVKDKPGQFILTPVWDFFGGMQNEYDMEAIKKDIKGQKVDNKTYNIAMENYNQIQDKEVSNGYNSFITINAIEGSVINRNLGY